MAAETEDARRARLLKAAHGIEGVLVQELGTWIGGLELEVATSHGVGIANVQDCSNGGTLGPFRIPPLVYRKIKDALEAGPEALSRLYAEPWDTELPDEDDADNPDEDDDEPSLDFQDLVNMVREGYTAETDYYVLKGENPIYGRDPDALTKEWEESLEGNVGDWELWDDMSTDHLEERLASFGVEVA